MKVCGRAGARTSMECSGNNKTYYIFKFITSSQYKNTKLVQICRIIKEITHRIGFTLLIHSDQIFSYMKRILNPVSIKSYRLSKFAFHTGMKFHLLKTGVAEVLPCHLYQNFRKLESEIISPPVLSTNTTDTILFFNMTVARVLL